MKLLQDLAPSLNPGGQQIVGSCGSCAWSSDGRYFAWSCGHRIVKVIRHNGVSDSSDIEDPSSVILSNGEAQRLQPLTIDAGDLVWSVAFGCRSTCKKTNNGRYRFHVFDDVTLAIGLRNGRIRTWDIKTGQLKLELSDHNTIVSDLRFAPDGSLRLISGSHDGTIKVWDIDDDGNMTKTIRTIYHKVFGCCWSPDAKYMVAVGDHKSVHMWDMRTYTLVRRMEGHLHYVSKCEYSPDGTLIATASYDTRVIVWDAQAGIPLMELFHMRPPPSLIFAGGANGAYVRGVSFSHDSQYIASVCDNGFLRVWNINDHDLPEEEEPVHDARFCLFSPDGTEIAAGTSKGHALIWKRSLQVSSLQQLCRSLIRRHLDAAKIESAKSKILPNRLVEYLQYSF